MPFIHENRPIAVICPSLGENVLLFRRMTGFDQISRLFEYHLEMLSANKKIDFAKVIGKPITVELKLANGAVREFNGIVTRFSCSGELGEYTRYIAVVRPWLWLLTRTSDCRIFPQMTVIEIIKKVCYKDVYGGLVDLDTTRLSKPYPKMDYCVQYRETDFNFVCRLLEHWGIYYFFKHGTGKHTMVLADSHAAHDVFPGYADIEFATDAQGFDPRGQERISSWTTTGEVESSGFELNDFDFEKMMGGSFGQLRAKESIPAAYRQPEYQQYDFPGGYHTVEEGHVIADARIQAHHGQSEQVLANTNARGLVVGALFKLKEHPQQECNREYLVTHAEYRLAAGDYGSGGGSGGRVFDCTFNALGTKYPFRTERSIPKPLVYGPQTAVVVGKAGEEIWTDKYGRVKVQFHWDREGKRDEKSSCWVRVSQGWAGARWGSMFIPRIGMEVVVEFLDGDPDRPLITGCVYNSATMPPYDLPANQTRSTVKSNSSKGGSGFNEIRFEDKKDAEEIFVQAQFNYNRVVKHNDTLKVGFLAKQPGSQTVEIKLDQHLEVGNDQIVHIIKNQKVNVDETQKVHVGKTCVIEAGTSIELKVGNSSILIEAGKISLKSSQIAIEAKATAELKGALVMVKGTPIKLN